MFKKKKRPHLFVRAWVRAHIHRYSARRTHTHLHCGANKFLHTRNTMCAHTWTHAGSERKRETEHQRLSAPSEWVPFLTPLSKYPCVNTADQPAERATGEHGGTDGESKGLHKDFLQFRQLYLSLYQPRLTPPHTWPCRYMQEANRSVAMATVDRPRVFLCLPFGGCCGASKL